MSKQRINDTKTKNQKAKCLFGNELKNELDSIKNDINMLSNSIQREREREQPQAAK